MPDPAWERLKEICETATSVVGLRLALDSERPTVTGWTVFGGAEKWARSEDPADLGEALGPVKTALVRLAEGGDADAARLIARFPGDDEPTSG